MKQILVGFAALFVSLSTQAAYLYWQVDSSDYTGFASANKYAVYAIKEGSSVQISATSTQGSLTTANVTDYSSGYSFYVELINWESAEKETALARSKTVTYADLSGDGHIAASLPGMPNVTAWHASGYTAVPEPSSAMLVMLGMGLLALKRRK